MSALDVPAGWRERLFDPGSRTSVVLGAIVIAFAGLLFVGGCYDAALSIGSGVRRGQGEVVAIRVSQGYRETHRVLTVRFRLGPDDVREFEQNADYAPEAVVGTPLTIAYHPDRERDFARLITRSDDMIRWVLWSGAALLGLEGLVLVLLPYFKARRRAWLIRHGRRLDVTVVGIGWHPFSFQGLRNWRVVARWLHADTGTWYDAHSGWFSSAANIPGPAVGQQLPAFVHPRKPRRSWVAWPSQPLATPTSGNSAPRAP